MNIIFENKNVNRSAYGAIVCGLDLSIDDNRALEVSAALANRLTAPLIVAHGVDLPNSLLRDGPAARWLAASRKRTVRLAAEAIRARGLRVAERVEMGRPDVLLTKLAAKARARLLVLGGNRRGRWERMLGLSVAGRTIPRAETPMLILRDAEPLRSWLGGGRPLKVFLGYGGTPACETALEWVVGLAGGGPIELEVGCIGEVPASAARVAEVTRGIPVRWHLAEASRRPDRRLLELANECGADVVVTGANRRRGFARLFRRSVSLELASRSEKTVLIVPNVNGVRPWTRWRPNGAVRRTNVVPAVIEVVRADSVGHAPADDERPRPTMPRVWHPPRRMPTPDRPPEMLVRR